MIKNSEWLYIEMRDYQNERQKIESWYRSKLKQLEAAKGSKYFEQETEKAAKEKEQALEELEAKTWPEVVEALKAMRERNGKRPLKAPTAEQLALLQALKLRENVTADELDKAANSLEGNETALFVLSDIARANGILKAYHGTELSIGGVDRLIDGLKAAAVDFMRTDKTRAARAASAYYDRMYGKGIEDDSMATVPIFESKEEFYSNIAGMDLEAQAAFFAAID